MVGFVNLITNIGLITHINNLENNSAGIESFDS